MFSGVLGQVGWFITSFTLDSKPQLASYRGFKTAADAQTVKTPLQMCAYCVLGTTSDAMCDAWTNSYVTSGTGCSATLATTAPSGVWDAYYVASLSDTNVNTYLANLNPAQTVTTPYYKGAFSQGTT
eukprot:4702206-Prymnesium_polylepis.1